MPRPRSDIRPRIIAAARERFLVEGVDGASLRSIAKDAGTSIGMVYYYFKTKDDLFLGVIEDVYEKVLADLAVALADDVPPDQRIERLYARFGSLSDKEFTVIRIVIREALVSNDRLQHLIARMTAGHLPMAIALVLQGVGDGTFRDDRPVPTLLMSIGLLAVIPQIIRRVVANANPELAAVLPTPEAIADHMLHIVLDGIRRRE